jgi:predicted AlkP superfamily pyrophosphatase or phosphodiesterase
MKWRFTAVLGLLLLGTPIGAQAPAQPSRRPKLVIVIAVDQFSADLFNEYRGHFTGGLRRLAQGAAFANGYQAHAVTHTCPGHAAIVTGDHPSRTGVIADHWYDFSAARANKEIDCGEDETAATFTASPGHLRVPTFGDRLKETSPSSRVVVVAGKERTAAMLGGRAFDERWWWDEIRFVENGPSASLPLAAQVNAAVDKAIAQPTEALVPPDFCVGKDRAFDVGGFSVGTFRFQHAGGDASVFANGPELDAATLTLAAALTQQLQLGRRPATDLLAIGLSATDLVGHRYGNGGLEMCLQLASLDRDLGDFFELLDEQHIDYAVVLSADHGSLDIPARLHARGVADAAALDGAATIAAISAQVARRLGLTDPVLAGDGYLTPNVPPGRRNEVLTLARQLLTAQPQVHSVYTKTEVAVHPMPKAPPEDWSILDRLRASYDAERSGDLEVVYKPNVTPPRTTKGYVAGHGSAWDYDRKVPILFWWPGLAPQNRPESAMTVDIMPTLASLVGLTIPQGEVDGHCLDLLPGPESNCR